MQLLKATSCIKDTAGLDREPVRGQRPAWPLKFLQDAFCARNSPRPCAAENKLENLIQDRGERPHLPETHALVGGTGP